MENKSRLAEVNFSLSPTECFPAYLSSIPCPSYPYHYLAIDFSFILILFSISIINYIETP